MRKQPCSDVNGAVFAQQKTPLAHQQTEFSFIALNFTYSSSNAPV
jgi:hypothetical protein